MNYLKDNYFKPDLNIRVNNITIDGVINYNGGEDPEVHTNTFLNAKDGFRKLELLDLERIGMAAPNGYLTNNNGLVSFTNVANTGNVANGTEDGQVPYWDEDANKFLPGPAPEGNVDDGVNPGDIPMWSAINQKYLPGTIPPPVSNVEDGTTDGQVPVWSVGDNKYIAANGGSGLPNGTVAKQVLMWDEGESFAYWGTLELTRDLEVNVLDPGLTYGTTFAKANILGNELLGVSNSGAVSVINSDNTSIFTGCEYTTALASKDLIVAENCKNCAAIATTGDNTYYAIFGDNTGATNSIVGASTNPQIYRGTNNVILASTGNVAENINLSDAECSAQIATDNCNNQLSVCSAHLASQACIFTSGSRNAQIASVECTTVNGFQCMTAASESCSVGNNSSHCSIEASTASAVNTTASFSSLIATTRCSAINDVVNTAVIASNDSSIINSSEKCCIIASSNSDIGTISYNSAAICCDGVSMNQATRVAAFGFNNYSLPTPTSNKVLGGITSVQWCLHNDTGVIDVSSVNTTGTFPSGQTRYVTSDGSVNVEDYGRMCALDNNGLLTYAGDGQRAFGIVRCRESAPLIFGCGKSGKHPKTDMWGQFIRDKEGNLIMEEKIVAEKVLVETHGEYIVQSKYELVAGSFVVSDGDGFAKPYNGISNLRVFNALPKVPDPYLDLNGTKAYRCYINPEW